MLTISFSCPAGGIPGQRVSRPAATAELHYPGAGCRHPTPSESLLPPVEGAVVSGHHFDLCSCVQPTDPGGFVSLVQAKMATFEPSQRQSGSGVVPWSPPQVNWNPWTSSNIDEGPLAFVRFPSRSNGRALIGRQRHHLL